MWFLAILIAVPLIEIALFIQVGGWLTLWPTLALIVATTIIGLVVVRLQGLRTLAELQRSVEGLGDPMAPMAHGAMILFAGLLLLTPGFMTDTLGFLLLLPPLRREVIRSVGRRQARRRAHVHSRHGPQRPGPVVIDADFRELPNSGDEDARGSEDGGQQGGSGWTRH